MGAARERVPAQDPGEDLGPSVLGRVSEATTNLSSYRYSTTSAENDGGRKFPDHPAAGLRKECDGAGSGAWARDLRWARRQASASECAR